MDLKKISYSNWQLWKTCQWRWFLETLCNKRRKIYSVHMDFGTAIHKSIESLKNNDNKKKKTLEESKKEFRKEFEKLLKKNANKYDKKIISSDEEFFFSAGNKILDDFNSDERLSESKTMFNELKLMEKIERADTTEFYFKGYVDLIILSKSKRGESIIIICDMKTCSWGWGQDKKRDTDLLSQLFLYKYFFCKKFDLNPKNVRAAFLLLKKKPGNKPSIEWFDVSAGPIVVQRAIDSLNVDITEMLEKSKDKSFKKNRNSCIDSWGGRCPFYETNDCT